MGQMTLFNDEGEWLARLRDRWFEAIRNNYSLCPCCDRKGKIYKANLHKTMALALRWINIYGEVDGWIDVQNRGPRWMLKGKNYCLLEHWQLIESKSHRSGVWRITDLGKSFVNGQCSLPVSVYIYDNTVKGFDSEEVSFRGCFALTFDFDEMMSARFNWANLKGNGNV